VRDRSNSGWPRSPFRWRFVAASLVLHGLALLRLQWPAGPVEEAASSRPPAPIAVELIERDPEQLAQGLAEQTTGVIPHAALDFVDTATAHLAQIPQQNQVEQQTVAAHEVRTTTRSPAVLEVTLQEQAARTEDVERKTVTPEQVRPTPPTSAISVQAQTAVTQQVALATSAQHEEPPAQVEPRVTARVIEHEAREETLAQQAAQPVAQGTEPLHGDLAVTPPQPLAARPRVVAHSADERRNRAEASWLAGHYRALTASRRTAVAPARLRPRLIATAYEYSFQTPTSVVHVAVVARSLGGGPPPVPGAAAAGAGEALAGAPRSEEEPDLSEIAEKVAHVLPLVYWDWARRGEVAGHTAVRFRLNRDGYVVDPSLIRSAGDPRIDRESGSALLLASPFTYVPGWIELSLTFRG